MPSPHISVCVCTYKRPHLIERLLGELARQQTGNLFTFSVVVTDNDGARSAEPVVADFKATNQVSVTYCVQPEQNIALARNTALGRATGDYIAFIDDDEFPGQDWLLTLFRAVSPAEISGALGPVLPFFDSPPPAWLVRGGFYDRPRHKTGFVIDWTEGRTGNVLFKRGILDGVAEPFRREFGSGGEDRNFFMRMIAKGHVFIWCDEAIAYEVVPPVRWNRKFMLRRALLRGKMSLNHDTCGLRGVAISLLAIPVYTLTLPLLLVAGHHLFMKYLIKICDHSGRVLAFLGINPVRESYVTE